MNESKGKEENKFTEELSQVNNLREMLFGQQFRDHEKKYLRFEERYKKDIENLRNEIQLRLNALEDIEKSIIKDAEDFKRNTVKIENDIRQINLNTAKELSAELNRVYKEMKNELTAEIRMLDELKIDKTALASMLGEIVMRLNSWPKDEQQEKQH